MRLNGSVRLRILRASYSSIALGIDLQIVEARDDVANVNRRVTTGVHS
jgi:hypothetical protein